MMPMLVVPCVGPSLYIFHLGGSFYHHLVLKNGPSTTWFCQVNGEGEPNKIDLKSLVTD
jgi:hypothetical protein